ncbi:hypothetical protein [Fibrobacter sp. UWH4]|uniref:hypothetical protein n=1 Tax=Fibrobacter sp. UWH4 TaxID=1896210 RepID=UPI000922A65B|nr:hypothetical protein [Fibrobacter sp. UWH4]SHL74197.1 hypothetical protein SAMN05720762_11249 [Fibrobacter sp. UWH4]
MGFFGNIWNGVKTFAVKAVKVVGTVLTKVAEVGEKVIKTVKEVWPRIKPWLEEFGSKLAEIPGIGPYLASAAQGLLALDKSPLLRAVGSLAEKWLPIVGRIGEKLKDWAEIKEAEAARKKVEEAEREEMTNRQREELLVCKILLHHKILVSKVAEKIKENDVSYMDSYLQLRAASRILEQMQKKWNAHELKASDFTSEDAFVLKFTENLIVGREVSETEANKFGDIVESMFGKPILAIVFDEMVKQWAADLELDRKKEEEISDTICDIEIDKETLEEYRKFGRMDEKKEARYKELVEKLEALANERELLKKSINHRQCYIEAAEGMLLVYEGDDALRSALEGRVDLNRLVEAIKNQIENVANAILQCMEGGKNWEDLSTEERMLIQDFSNIFKIAAAKRAEEIVNVVVGVA